MKFKFQKLLSDKQVFRAKWQLSVGLLIGIMIVARDYFVEAEEGKLMWNDETWLNKEEVEYPRGKIVYYSKNEVVCTR